jgi:hypothetical protein
VLVAPVATSAVAYLLLLQLKLLGL